MKKLVVVSLLSMLVFQSCDVLQNLPLKPSNFEVVSALRKILDSSAFKAINTIRKVNNGGVESLLPKEITPVLATMKTLGLGGEIDKVQSQIKSVSKVALTESEGIITDAVKNLSFTDAVSVVVGGKDAATQVLKKAMYASVKQRYSSKLNNEFEKSSVNKYWPMAVGAFNMFSDKKIDNDLSGFLAEKAVDALFMNMGKEEEKIRSNYTSLGSPLVNKVFDYYTKN